MMRLTLLPSVLFAIGACLTLTFHSVARETPDAAPLQSLQMHEKQVALVLANEGFEVYSKLFHPDYHNWKPGRPIKDRARFLADVKTWYEQGNKAIAVQMEPIFSEINGDFGLSQYRLREDFNDGQSFVGAFTSLSKRTASGWQFYNTRFNTEYVGPTADAPTLELQAPGDTGSGGPAGLRARGLRSYDTDELP